MVIPITRGDEDSEADVPELWLFGVSSPASCKPFNAGGVRLLVDMRTLDLQNALASIDQYSDTGLGFCLTIRWLNPEYEQKSDAPTTRDFHTDVPPTDEEAEEAIDNLLALATSDAAIRMGDKLWIQMFNEIAGGPGTILPEDADVMFDFATELARRLDVEAPHVRICGPALTGTEVLDREDIPEDDEMGIERHKLLTRAIEWSAQYADAIDSHLHAENGAWTHAELMRVRRELDNVIGGEKVDIVSWEWSCARYEDQEDKEGAVEAMVDIWHVMTDFGVTQAAYAPYMPNENLNEIYRWMTPVQADGNPNEPFHARIVSIGHGEYDDESDDGLDDGDEDDEGDELVTMPSLWAGDQARLPISDITDDGAAGGRWIFNARVEKPSAINRMLRDCRKNQIGACVTVRLSDETDPEQYDAVPSERDQRKIKGRLIRSMKSRNAQLIAENGGLWLQVFDEVGGTNGHIRPEDADELFEYATDLVVELREKTPHTQICGPGLNNTEVLDIDPADRTVAQQETYDILETAVLWSIEHADAIDVRVVADGADSATAILTRVRSFIDSKPGGVDLPLVCWSWNASSADIVNDETSQANMLAVWDAVIHSDVTIATYGPYYADSIGGDVSLTNSYGSDHDPYASTFHQLALELGQIASEPEGDDSGKEKKGKKKSTKKAKKAQPVTVRRTFGFGFGND